MKALVTAELRDDHIAELTQAGYDVTVAGWGVNGDILEGDTLVNAAAGSELIVTELERIDDAVLEAAPRLHAVASCRGNPANVDLEAATRHGVPVLHTPGRNADSVADFTIGLLLALVRSIGAGERHLRATGWTVDGKLPYLEFRGPELAGRTLGLIGYGAIGRRVAQRAHSGFGMKIRVHDPYATINEAGVTALELDELAQHSDVLSIHVPDNVETQGMIGAQQLALLGPEGYLINTARAAAVEEGALITALEEGGIAGAALDVFWKEPLRRDHPLLDLQNVIITPHLAGAANDVKRHHGRMVLDDLDRLRRGVRPTHLANPAVWNSS